MFRTMEGAQFFCKLPGTLRNQTPSYVGEREGITNGLHRSIQGTYRIHINHMKKGESSARKTTIHPFYQKYHTNPISFK